MDPSSLCSSLGVTQSEAGLGNGGLNQRGSGLPFKCSGIDQVRPSLGSQPQEPFETANQFQLLSPEPKQKWLRLLRLRRLRLQLERELEWERHQEWELEWQRQLERELERLKRQLQELELLQLQELELLQLQELELLQLQELEKELLQLQILLPLQPDPWLQLELLLLQLELPKLELPLLEQLELLELPPPPLLELWGQLRPPPPLQLLEQLLDATQFLLAQSRGSSIQASSPKVGVDSQDQEELTMEASTIRSLPINPSPLYSQGVAQSKAGLVNGGGSSFDDINGTESQQKLCLNTSLPVDNDFDHSDESKHKRKRESSVWKFYKRITEKDGKERAQCIKCGVKYRIDSKKIGTSTVRRHKEKCFKNETPGVGQLEPKDQGPEPIQEENIIEARTPERPCVPQAHISSAVQSASGVLGTTTAVTTKRRQFAFRPTSHDSANKSAGTEADEGKSSTPPAATEEMQAPRDLQLSLATTKSAPQEESGSVHKQFASAEELRSIGEQKKALKITLNGILDSLSKGQIECLERCKIAVEVVLHTVGSAVDVKPLEAIFTELFASSKEWQSIQDPASLYQSEVLDQAAMLRRELNEERELANKERSLRAAKFKQAKLYEEKSDKHKEIILTSLDQQKVLDRAMLREPDEERELVNEEQSSWIDSYRRQLLLNMDKNLKHQENIKREASKRLRRIGKRFESKISRLKTFVSKVEGILGVGLGSAVPEVAAQKYAAHKREAMMKAQLQDFSGKINDFFKE